MVLSAKTNPDGWSGFLLIFFPPPTPSPPFSGRLLSKTLSTLSICSLLILATFLLFTLSTFEPSAAALRRHPPRRLLLSTPAVLHRNSDSDTALQGMGILYRRGTRSMPDLIVAHVSESLTEIRFRTFLRVLHSTGLLARSDLAFVFSSNSISSKLSPIIIHENDSLLKLVTRFSELNRTSIRGLARYLKNEKKETKETIWGKKASNQTSYSYGSIVGFDSSELDPDNSLSGFLDNAPMGLRRWACYPMLLGRLKRAYKHIVLADPARVNLLTDPFARVRNQSSESVYLLSGTLAGGSRGVRRLSDAVLNEIVRASMEKKKKKKTTLITESEVMDRLRRGGHLFKNVNVIEDSGSGGTAIDDGLRDSLWCWSDLHSEVYRDCLR